MVLKKDNGSSERQWHYVGQNSLHSWIYQQNPCQYNRTSVDDSQLNLDLYIWKGFVRYGEK